MSSDEEEALPNSYTYRYPNGPITINAVMDLDHSSQANQNFMTLAHEALHALHFSRLETSLGQVDSFISDFLDRLITDQADQALYNDMLCDSKKWFQVFNDSADLVNRLKATSKADLANVKLDLISEEVAYRKTAYLARLSRSQDIETKTANGYRAAIQWINTEIDKRS